MFKLNNISGMREDCTSLHEVILDKSYTLKEFIDAVLTREEWGKISIVDVGSYKYKRNVLIDSIPEELFDFTVMNVSSSGGWSNMDYKISFYSK